MQMGLMYLQVSLRKKEGGRGVGVRVREGDMTMEAELRVIKLLAGGHKPRSIYGSLQAGKCKGADSPLEPPQRSQLIP